MNAGPELAVVMIDEELRTGHDIARKLAQRRSDRADCLCTQFATRRATGAGFSGRTGGSVVNCAHLLTQVRNNWLAVASNHGVNATTFTEAGNIAAGVESTAIASPADLIVIGRNGEHPLWEDNSYGIAARTPCPVLRSNACDRKQDVRSRCSGPSISGRGS